MNSKKQVRPRIVCYVVLCLLVARTVEGQATTGEGYRITTVNVSEDSLSRPFVNLSIQNLPSELLEENIRVQNASGRSVRSQLDDLNGDGTADELVIFAGDNTAHTRTFHLLSGDTDQPPVQELADNKPQHFSNRHLAVSLNNSGMADVSVRGGNAVLENFGLRGVRGNRRTPGNPELVANGPLRTVVDQPYKIKGTPFKIIGRFVLYAEQSKVEYHLIFKNKSEETRPLPDFVDGLKVLRGQFGPPISRGFQQNIEILSVNVFQNHRRNMLWLNGETGYGLGWTMHDHHLRRLGPPLWRNPTTKSLDGRWVHARPYHEWVIPDLPLQEIRGRLARTYGPRIRGFGGIRQFKTDQKPGMFKSGRGMAFESVNVAPGEQFSTSMSFYVYERASAPEQVIKDFEKDADTVAGMVNVYGEDQRILKTARGPNYVTSSFDEPASEERWLTTDGASAKVRNGSIQIKADSGEGGIYTPGRRNFIDSTELRGRLSSVPENTTVRFQLEDQERGTVHTVAERTESGSFRTRIDEKFPYRSPRNILLRVQLVREDGRDTGEPLTAGLDRLSLAWVTPTAPEIVSPAENQELTDIAFAVNLNSTTPHRTDIGYVIQIARDKQFEDVVYGSAHPASMRVRGNTHRDRTFLPPDVPANGTYYVRARGIGVQQIRGDWSEPVKVVVDSTDHVPVEPVREVGPDHPLVYIPSRRPSDFKIFRANLPEAIRSYFVCEVSYPDFVGKGIETWVKHGFPIILRFYGHTDADLALVERLFRKHPNVIGFTFGESGFPGTSMFRGVKLCAKYGRYAGNFGGFNQIGMGASSEFYDLLSTHGRYVVSIPKGQHPGFIGERYGPVLGLWLTERLRFFGVETEWWVPEKIGIPDEKMHAVDWMPPYLFGLSTGASVWRIETFISNKKHHGLPKRADQDTEFGPLWKEGMKDFFMDLERHDLIPSREKVRNKVSTAILTRPGWLTKRIAEFPDELVKQAHGHPEGSRQWIPNSDRKYAVPLLPPHVTEREKKLYRNVVDVERFDSVEEAKTYFERVNGDETSEAYSVLVGDTGVVTNTRPKVWPPDPVEKQPYSMAFDRGPVDSIQGKVGYHQYLIAKQSDGQLYVHANNYTDRTTTITFSLTSGKTPIRVKPETAVESNERTDDGTKITVNHKSGVVRFYAGSK